MKTNRFKNALYAQIIWFSAATIFNVLSIKAIADGQIGWAGPTPVSSQAVATAMATVILFGFLKWRKTYLVTASVVLAFLLLGGVGRHIFAAQSVYASTTTWATAIGINVFGCLTFLVGIIYAKNTG